MRVLLADDSREIRSALRLALSEVTAPGAKPGRAAPEKALPGRAGKKPAPAPCTVLEAKDMAEMAVFLATYQDLDLILLDWELPGLDVVQMMALVRARNPRCVVVAMSGDPGARDRSLKLGADHFVAKNDPPSRLLGLLRDLHTADGS